MKYKTADEPNGQDEPIPDDGQSLSQCEIEIRREENNVAGMQRDVAGYKKAIERTTSKFTEGNETLDAMRKMPTRKGMMWVETGDLHKVDFSRIEKFISTEITPFDVAAQVNYTGSYNMTLGKNLKPSHTSNWALPIGTLVMVFFIIIVLLMVAKGAF